MMKKFLFLMLGLMLLSMSFVSALTVQDVQDLQNSIQQQAILNEGQPPTPIDIIKLGLKNSPEFKAEFIKSILIIISIMLLTVVDAILKGFAMWKASKNNSKVWFWVLLLVSSLGILPLCYLIFSKKEPSKKEEHKKK